MRPQGPLHQGEPRADAFAAGSSAALWGRSGCRLRAKKEPPLITAERQTSRITRLCQKKISRIECYVIFGVIPCLASFGVLFGHGVTTQHPEVHRAGF